MKAEIAMLRAVAEKMFEGCMTVNGAFALSDQLLRVIDKINELEKKEHEREFIDSWLKEPEPELETFDSELIEGDLTGEMYRVYDIPGRDEPYRIFDPVTLYTRPGGTTHRVLDRDGKVHCIPMSGTVLRWKSRNSDNPVAF